MTAFIPTSTIVRSANVRPLLALQDASSFLTAAAQEVVAPTTTTTTTLPSGTTFEAILPDTSVLFGFAGIAILSALAVWVWANQVVPVSRTNLAMSKQNGPVKDYLDDLRQAGGGNATATSTTTTNATSTTTNTTEDNRDFERWMFTDWLEKPEKKAGRQKEPALPILKKAKWNSGDNPVLAASALIGLGVLFTSVTERITSSF